jgi:hypothetical protein
MLTNSETAHLQQGIHPLVTIVLTHEAEVLGQFQPNYEFQYRV